MPFTLLASYEILCGRNVRGFGEGTMDVMFSDHRRAGSSLMNSRRLMLTRSLMLFRGCMAVPVRLSRGVRISA